MTKATIPRIDHDTIMQEQDTVATRVLLSWRERAAAYFASNFTQTRGLIIAGSVTAFIYLLLTIGFPLTTWWFRTDDNLGSIPIRSSWSRILLKFGGPHALNSWLIAFAILFVIILFALQAWAVYAARLLADIRQTRRIIIGFAIAFLGIQFWMQPITSTDEYGYLARSYLIATLHQNPMISLATQLSNAYLVSHARPPSPYGPLWLLICGGIGLLEGDNLFLGMLLMKLVMVAAAIATIFLVDWLAGKLYPNQRSLVLVLFAWSPLLIFEAAGNAHNDIVMMLCVVGSLAVIQVKRPLFAFPLLALGVLIKYSVGALVPIYAAFLLMKFCWVSQADEQGSVPLPKNRAELRAWLNHIDLRRVLVIFGGGGAISVALAALCYGPFWVGLKTFTGLTQQLGATYFNASLAQVVYAGALWLTPGLKEASVGSAVRLVFYAIFAVYTLWETGWLLRIGPDVTIKDLAQSAGKVLFAALILVTFWYQPWYIVWLLPLAALSPDLVLRRHSTTLALGGLLTYAIANFGFTNQSDATRQAFIQLFLMFFAFAPLLILRHSSSGSLLDGIGRAFSGLNQQITRFPYLTNRVILGLILAVAAALRLVKLGGGGATSAANTTNATLSDARGLEAPFTFVQSISTHLFGQTTFAALLPTALIGTITVWLIYRLALALFATVLPERHRIVALLAALLAATSRWHVDLSRAGLHVVLLPLLIAGATLALWQAFQTPPTADGTDLRTRLTERRTLLLVVAGIGFGLIADLEPAFWLMPVIFLVLVAFAWWQRRDWFANGVLDALALVISTAIASIPIIKLVATNGYHLADASTGSSVDTGFANHLNIIISTIIRQNFNSFGPAADNVTILPWLVTPFALVGIFLLIQRWRRPESIIIALLTAIPLLLAISSAAANVTIATATLLPVICIVPALGLEEATHWLATIPGVLAGPKNKIFLSQQNLVRVSLLMLVLVMTASTFIWYFASTLPGPAHQIHP